MKHTGSMPWDKMWDFSKYRVSGVRRIVRRYRVMELKDEIKEISGREDRSTN